MIISYETLRNRTDWLTTVPPGVLQSEYRDEAADLFVLLEANPTMADGNPAFGAGNSAAGALDFATLLALFRAQKVRGGERVLGSEPRYLVTPAAQELAMRKELKAADLSDSIEVISRADVSNLYLIGDPIISPCLFRVGLTEIPNLSVRTVPRGAGDVAVTCEDAYIFSVGSRYGICRMTPT